MILEVDSNTVVTVVMGSVGLHAVFIKLSIDSAIRKAMSELQNLADKKFISRDEYEAHVKMCPLNNGK